MEEFIKKAGMLIPLIIAAGYFIFLIGTWNKFLAFQEVMKSRVDKYLDNLATSKSDDESN